MVEELTGTSKKIYYYMLRKARPITPKEIQRELNISTISLVKYHLQKLQEAGLIKETDKGYVVVKVLDDYAKMRNIVLPKSFFFASFFTSSLGLGIYFFIKGDYKADALYLLLLLGISIYLFVNDTLKKWKKLLQE